MEAIKLASEHLKTYIDTYKTRGFSWGLLWQFAEETVKVVEKIAEDVNNELEEAEANGESKRDLAVRLLNDNIDIPLLPEFMEKAIFGWAIDSAVKKIFSKKN